jgi:hypothetical protein
VGSLSRKRYTQYVEQNRKGHPWVLRHAQSLENRLAATANTRHYMLSVGIAYCMLSVGEKVKTGRGPIMEETL